MVDRWHPPHAPSRKLDDMTSEAAAPATGPTTTGPAQDAAAGPVAGFLAALAAGEVEIVDLTNRLSSQTLDPMYMTLEQFAARLKTDSEKYERLVRISGAKVD